MRFQVKVYEVQRPDTYTKKTMPGAVDAGLAYTFSARTEHRARTEVKSRLSKVRDIRSLNIGPNNTIIVYVFPDKRRF